MSFMQLLNVSCVTMEKKPKKFDLEFDFENFKKKNMKPANKAQYDTIKTFFHNLIDGFHSKSFNLENLLYTTTKEHLMPQLLSERNQYSLFASTIAEITPIHLSEWGISCVKGENKNRRIDFWCLYHDEATEKNLNFFIELKRNYYCLSKNSNPWISAKSAEAIRNLEEQLRSIRDNPLNYEGDGEFYLGIMVTTCWLGKKAKQGYYLDDAKNAIKNVIHGNSRTQIMQAYCELDDNYQTQDIYNEDGEINESYCRTKYIIFTGFVIEKS